MTGLECLGLVLLVTVVHGRIVDIRKEVSYIVKFHNNERREKHLKASDMLEMMITAQANRIGCALSTCSKLDNGIRIESSASLFVCFYSPRTNIMASVPYRKEFCCSQCPVGTFCHRGLCSQKAVLTPSEIQQLTSAHNRIRTSNNRDPLTWDSYLERWAQWIVSCSSDYPGPAHSYTNFERLQLGDEIYQKICNWPAEGQEANIQLIHACRTPYDRARCNHYTNVLQPMLTSMACAAQVCSDETRQLVCIYDNKVNRVLRLRHQFE